MSSFIGRGLAAGAVGTTVLNVVTYADMAFRGRDASSTPEQTVEALAGAAGLEIAGRGKERSNRLTALGALLGSAAGVGVGLAAAASRAAGLRIPAPFEAVLTGAAAMAASDVPMALLGVSDPREWSQTDWVSDALPHLAYGAATVATLRALDGGERPVRRAPAGLVFRSALLGIATGSRSTLGLAVPALTSRPTVANPDGGAGLPARLATALMMGGELVGDKLPGAPDRTTPQALVPRFVAAAAGATALARREGANATFPTIAAAAGASAGAWGGLAWRHWASDRLPATEAALLEDAVALVLAVLACRGPATEVVVH